MRACYQTRKLYPKKTTILKYYLPGLVLSALGLSIFAVFTTKSNYWILHSLWHIIMATAIVFFLPKRHSKTSARVARTVGSDEESLPAGKFGYLKKEPFFMALNTSARRVISFESIYSRRVNHRFIVLPIDNEHEFDRHRERQSHRGRRRPTKQEHPKV